MSGVTRRGTKGPKRLRQFEKVAEATERLRHLSSAELKARLARGYLLKEAAIAIRQLLDERGESGE